MALRYKFDYSFLASEAGQKKKIVFWHLKHVDKWDLGKAIGDRLFFFTVPLSNITVFSQNQSKEFFFEKKTSPPPPEYQMDRALGVFYSTLFCCKWNCGNLIGCLDGSMVSYLQLHSYIWRAWRQGYLPVTSWKPIILDVVAGFYRAIFKRRECFSRLNVFTV